MKNFFLLALTLAFFSAPALAEDGVFLTAAQPAEVLAGDSTFFDVTIWNNRSESEWFSVSAYPADWISLEGGVSALFLGAYDYRTFRVSVAPSIDARSARYIYTISAQSEKSGRSSVDVAVPVQQRYTGVLLTDFSASCSSCSDSVELSAVVKNVGNVDLQEANVIFSAGGYAKAVQIESMRQGEEKTIRAKFLTGFWEPKEYFASAKLESKFGSDYKSLKFSVSEVKKITSTKYSQKTLLGTTVYITLRNEGNVPDTASTIADKSDLLVAVYPESKPSSITGNALTWYAALAPGEERTISYSQIFWPIPFGSLFALLLAGYGYMLATAIEIRKSILGRGSVLGISLHVKNKGSDADGVVVKDIVPSNFSVIPEFETSKPIMRKTADGTELLWRLGTVKRGDDVMLHYKIKSSSPSGGALPKAVLRCKRGLSPMQKTSNFVVVRRVPGAQVQKVKVVVEE